MAFIPGSMKKLVAGLALVALALPSLVRAQQPTGGTITGTVTDVGTKRPVAGASVYLESNTRAGALTNDVGKFTLRNVPPGAQRVVARYLGYVKMTVDVTVANGASATADFALSQTANVLDAVVTTGTKAEEEIKSAPTPVTVLSSASIEQSGAQRIDKLLNGQVPGVFSIQPGPYDYTSYVFSRGSSALSTTSKMKVYVDGIELADGYYLASIDPSSIDHMEIIRGPQASTVYGSEAQNGVIQVFTKKGAANMKPRTDLTVSFGGITGPFRSPNSYGMSQDHKLSFTGGGQDVSYNAGGTYGRTGAWVPGYRADVNQGYASSRMTIGNTSVEASGRFGQRTNGYPGDPLLVARVRDGTVGFPSYISRANSHYYDDYVRGYRLGSIRTTGRNYGINANYAPFADWTHNLVLGRDETELNYMLDRLYDYDPTSNYFYKTQQSKTSYTYSNNFKHSLGRDFAWTLTTGGDYWSYAYYYNYQYGGLKGLKGTIGTGTLGSQIQYWTLYNGGYYAQQELGFRDKLFLTAGARTEVHPGFGKQLTWLDRTAPRVGLAYNVAPLGVPMKWRVSYGTAFQPPSGSMLFTTDGGTYRYIVNPDLKPERQSGGDMGVEAYFGTHYSVNFTYYSQKSEDLIAVQYLTGYGYVGTVDAPAQYQYQNVGAIKNTGLESELTLNFNPWTMHLTHTYQSSIPTTLYTGYVGFARIGTQLWRVPHHIGNASLQYTSRRLTAGGDVGYLGPRRNLAYTPFYYRVYGRYAKNYSGPNGVDTYNDYFGWFKPKITGNANASFELRPQVTLFGRVNNFLNDMSGSLDDDYLEQGRSFSLGFKLKR